MYRYKVYIYENQDGRSKIKEYIQNAKTKDSRVLVNKIVLYIRYLKEKVNISQEQLAEKAGMKQSAISRIENMKISPSVDTLMHLLYQIGYTLKVVPLSKNKE